MKQQLFQLFTEFESWQDDHGLTEPRLVQHDLIHVHLARLYGSLSSNAQNFGLVPPFSLAFEIQEQGPVALSELLAVTASGKLLVCAKAEIQAIDNHKENKGLFAIARPVPMSKALQKTLPDLPWYQVQLEWRDWQGGIDELVKTGEGLPLGRLKDGQWDANYIPPVMSLTAHQILWQQATELMNRVKRLASRDSRVAEQVLALRQTDLASLTPLAFWQAHCQCLVALKDHPKLVDDAKYQELVSKLLSESFLPWVIGEGLETLRSGWRCVELGLDKEIKPAKKPRRYVSLGWYVFSTAAMVLLAVLLGMDLVYQSDKSMTELKAVFKNQLAVFGNKPTETAGELFKQLTVLNNKQDETAGELSKRLTALDNKHVQTADGLSKQLSVLDNKQAETADELSKQLTVLDNKHVQTADDLSKQLTAVNKTADELSKQVTTLDNKHAETADGLSKRLTAVNKTAGELSKRLTALDNKHVQAADGLSKRLTALDNKHVQAADELSKQLTALDNKHVQAADGLSKQLTALDNKQAETADDSSSKPLAKVDKKHVQTADSSSKPLAKVEDKHGQTADSSSKPLAKVDKKHVQTADNSSKPLAKVDKKHGQTADDSFKPLAKVEKTHGQTADDSSKPLAKVEKTHGQTADDSSKQLVKKDDNINWTSGKILRDRLKDGNEGPEMVVIKAGTFRMGDIQGNGDNDEQPVHEVSIEESIAIGRYEVTVGEFRQFVNATGYQTDAEKQDSCSSYTNNRWDDVKGANWRNPGFSQSDTHSVTCLSWNDANAYAKWLTEQTGHHYRLPTEAEWEYAARAGTTTKYWWGNDIGSNQANCDNCGDSFKHTAPVGSFAANPFGLFDTVGNVWEWTCSNYQYKYTGKEQRCAKNNVDGFAVRGGSWLLDAHRARAANRDGVTPSDSYDNLGTRLVMHP
jgi:formylglycine-generating enzyme required for sulfatase activity/cell division septal protein FtsQ